MSIQEKAKRGRLMIVAGVVSLIFGGLLFFFEQNNFVIRTIGIFLCALGAYQIKAGNASRQDQNAVVIHESAPSIGYFTWGFGIFIALLAAVSFAFLYKDAIDGYKGVWQVYAFAGIAIIFTLTWGYIKAKLKK